MGVLKIKIIAARFHLIGSNQPGHFIFHTPFSLPTAPPIDAWLEVLNANGLRHGVGFLSLRHPVLVEPDFFCRFTFLKKQKVGSDARVGLEYAIWQPDDGVEIALFH